jgi:hypothetical protein
MGEEIISSLSKSTNDYQSLGKLLFVPCADPPSIEEERGKE